MYYITRMLRQAHQSPVQCVMHQRPARQLAGSFGTACRLQRRETLLEVFLVCDQRYRGVM